MLIITRFTDKTLCAKKAKERALTKREGQYEVVGSLQFNLRSTADLRSLGFENVPVYYPTPPATAENEQTPASKAKALEATSPEPDNEESEGTSVGLFVKGGSPDPFVGNSGSTKPQNKGISSRRNSQPTPKIQVVIPQSPQAGSKKAKLPPTSTNPKEALVVDVDDEEVPETHLQNPLPSTLESIQEPKSSISRKESMDPVKKFLSGALSPQLQGIKKSTVKVEPIDLDTPSNAVGSKKGPTLPGLKGAPAHQAWLERGSTQADSSRASSLGPDERSQISQDDIPGGNKIANKVLEELRQSSQPPQETSPMDRSVDENATRHLSNEPKPTSKPPALMPVGVESEVVAHGMEKMQIASPDFSKENVQKFLGHPRAVIDPQQNENQTIATSLVSSQTSSDPMPKDFVQPNSSHAENSIITRDTMNAFLTHLNTRQNPPTSNPPKLTRGPSVAPSEAPTEVATEEEMEPARKKSSELALSKSQGTATIEQGAFPNLSQFTDPRTPDNPARSSIETPFARSVIGATAGITEQGSEGEGMSKTLFPNTPFRSSPTQASDPRRFINFSAEKRKAGSISGSPDRDIVKRPRKTVLSPASLSSPNSQRRILAAQARLAAAERNKQKLKEEYEAALAIQQKNAKACNSKSPHISTVLIVCRR
jgi:hypothetical protein